MPQTRSGNVAGPKDVQMDSGEGGRLKPEDPTAEGGGTRVLF